MTPEGARTRSREETDDSGRKGEQGAGEEMVTPESGAGAVDPVQSVSAQVPTYRVVGLEGLFNSRWPREDGRHFLLPKGHR